MRFEYCTVEWLQNKNYYHLNKTFLKLSSKKWTKTSHQEKDKDILTLNKVFYLVGPYFQLFSFKRGKIPQWCNEVFYLVGPYFQPF